MNTRISAILSIFLPLSCVARDWVALSLNGPTALNDDESFWYYVNNILIGTPPATESLFLDIQSPTLGVSSTDCVFCGGVDLFDPTLSSTFNTSQQPWSNESTHLRGILAQDQFSFGGVLSSPPTPFRLIQSMSTNLTIYRFLDGYFGLFVSPTNKTDRDNHVLTRLHSSGQLLNPVIGLRLDNVLNNSHITIGALDPKDYDGTINWIQAEVPDPSLNVPPVVIKTDGLRGANGSFLPYPSPLLAYLDTTSGHVGVPNAWTYMSSENYTGPVDAIEVDPVSGGYSFICNGTKDAYVPLSVDINGVTYQIDSTDNLLRKTSFFNDEDFCDVGIHNITTPGSVPSLLGLPFLRSVFLAYRFPTDDCPRAYYGFAFPKGANRTASMLAQQPSSTPSASAQCLALTTPTATPSVATPPPQHAAEQFLSSGKYSVWGSPDAPQVRLKGVDGLPAGLVRGPQGDAS